MAAPTSHPVSPSPQDPHALIDNQADLDALIDRLLAEPAVAVDCEMDAMYAYRTRICLMQLGWDGGDALVDCMRPLDWTALQPLFASRDVVKIFHGGENDIGLMTAHWGLRFETIFDTMSAAQVLGEEKVGLANLLQQHFDVTVSKKYQKADWRVRPLPPDQAEYARLDVQYLIPLRDMLLARLEELDRVEEAFSDFDRIKVACVPDKPFDPDGWARVKGVRELDPARRGVLAAVYAVRDRLSQRLDRAPYRVARDVALIEMARRLPKSPGQLRRLHGVHRGLSEAELGELLAAIEEGARQKECKLPAHNHRRRPWESGSGPMTPEEQALFDKLRAWRVKRADKRGVHISRVATNALLSSIVKAGPRDRAALAAVEGMEPWRMREYGDELIALLTA